MCATGRLGTQINESLEINDCFETRMNPGKWLANDAIYIGTFHAFESFGNEK